MALIRAIHEPGSVMNGAVSAIIRHVGYGNDVVNIWRFMIDALGQNGRRKLAGIAVRIK
ncbi:hypothetical protein P7B04_26190 [Sphingobium yanoikuyae]|uniref:hypothetical protein n=1 Tax=Sphingobium yanoikuyae TaxID=13690 RepID=UPI00240FA7DF|nr:hypothetical protein [Sphingobium yanoikuyae]MDG2516155.1 hypothetical protein [Sphingobium yanoikuyae]